MPKYYENQFAYYKFICENDNLKKLKYNKKTIIDKTIFLAIFTFLCVVGCILIISLTIDGKADKLVKPLVVTTLTVLEVIAIDHTINAYRFEMLFGDKEIRIKHRRKRLIFSYSEIKKCGFLQRTGSEPLDELLDNLPSSHRKSTFYFSKDIDLDVKKLKYHINTAVATDQGVYKKNTFYISDRHDHDLSYNTLLALFEYNCGSTIKIENVLES